MDGENVHITLTADAIPFCVGTTRTIPFAYRDKLKAELELLQEQHIITEPTDWCAPIVVTPKKGTDKIRMCVNLSHLNKYVKRERYQGICGGSIVVCWVVLVSRGWQLLFAMIAFGFECQPWPLSAPRVLQVGRKGFRLLLVLPEGQ